MYRDEIDRVLGGDPSELEQSVLADYHVSDAELAQAWDAFRVCMEELGYEVEFGANDVTTGMAAEWVDSFPDEEAAVAALQADSARCEAGTTRHISPLHSGMRDNPSGTTPMQKLRACFEGAGVEDGARVDDEELAAMIRSESYSPGPAATACLEELYGEWPLPGGGARIGVDMGDAEDS